MTRAAAGHIVVAVERAGAGAPLDGRAPERLAPARAAAHLRGRRAAARALRAAGVRGVRVVADPDGAPRVLWRDGVGPPVSVSISHAPTLSVAAALVGPDAVGIDVEPWCSPSPGLARRIGSGLDPVDFTERWTRLEAAAKARGEPVLRLVARPSRADDLWVRSLGDLPGHALALATTSRSTEIEVTQL